MAHLNTKKNLLLTGLTFDAKLSDQARAVFGSAESIEKRVRDDEHRAAQAGFTLTSFQLDVERIQEDLNRFRDYLESGKFDAVMIGGGIRLVPEQTELFETMVNMCRCIAPDTPLMFNSAPGTMTKCLERLYGARFD